MSDVHLCVKQAGNQFCCLSLIHAILLNDRERVIQFIDNKKGALANWLNSYRYFEIERFWIDREAVYQSTFEWPVKFFAVRRFPAIGNFVVNLFCYSRPLPPKKYIFITE